MKAKGVLGKFIAGIDKKSLARTRIRMQIAAAIDDALQAEGLSQKQFAEMVGKTESEISAILSGGRNFTIDTLTDICEELHLHLLDVGQKKTYYLVGNIANILPPKDKSSTMILSGDCEVVPDSLGRNIINKFTVS